MVTSPDDFTISVSRKLGRRDGKERDEEVRRRRKLASFVSTVEPDILIKISQRNIGVDLKASFAKAAVDREVCNFFAQL